MCSPFLSAVAADMLTYKRAAKCVLILVLLVNINVKPALGASYGITVAVNNPLGELNHFWRSTGFW